MPKITIDTELIDSKIAQLNLEIERLRHMKEVLPEMILDTVISSQKKPLASEFAKSNYSTTMLSHQYSYKISDVNMFFLVYHMHIAVSEYGYT